jgi:ethanolamine permease
MISLIVLRGKEPLLKRPFKVPFYPLSPLSALSIALISLIAMTYYNFNLALIYFSILIISFVGYKLFYKKLQHHD